MSPETHEFTIYPNPTPVLEADMPIEKKERSRIRQLNLELGQMPKDLKFTHLNRKIDNTTKKPTQQINIFINMNSIGRPETHLLRFTLPASQDPSKINLSKTFKHIRPQNHNHIDSWISAIMQYHLHGRVPPGWQPQPERPAKTTRESTTRHKPVSNQEEHFDPHGSMDKIGQTTSTPSTPSSQSHRGDSPLSGSRTLNVTGKGETRLQPTFQTRFQDEYNNQYQKGEYPSRTKAAVAAVRQQAPPSESTETVSSGNPPPQTVKVNLGPLGGEVDIDVSQKPIGGQVL